METEIPVYIINLKDRPERLKYVKQQFHNRPEFSVNVVEAIKHSFGAIGLWLTFQQIAKIGIEKNHDYLIMCEDDHTFTEDYDKHSLFNCIKEAFQQKADFLLGGPSWVASSLPIANNLYWIESFSGSQFVVVFKPFFAEIACADFPDNDGADFKLGRLTQKKFMMYPFISTQKDFGYSDATPKNNVEGRIESLFINCAESIRLVNHVNKHYQTNHSTVDIDPLEDFDNITIPTYIINLPERIDRREHILQQFDNKKEFDITLVDACKHEIGAVGLWHSIRKIAKMAIENDDDVIIICEDDHEFTPDYSRSFMFRNILGASAQGVDFLSGGCSAFGCAIPVTNNRFWANSLFATQFMIIYKPFFQKILNEPFTDEVQADIILSEITSSKMVIYPFISTQRDFGYSDVTKVHNLAEGIVTTLFERSNNRLSNIHKAFQNYC